MKRHVVGSGLAVLALGVGMLAQAPALPKPGPEQAPLGYYVGKWKSEAEIKPGPLGPGGKMTSMDTCEWFAGGFQVVCRGDGSGMMGKMTSLGVMAYSATEKAYTVLRDRQHGLVRAVEGEQERQHVDIYLHVELRRPDVPLEVHDHRDVADGLHLPLGAVAGRQEVGGAHGGQVDESELMHWTEIAPRLAGGVVVLDLKGQMTLTSEEAPHLLLRIRRAVEDGQRNVLLNLAHVSYVDSTGIGEIAGAYTRVVREGGMLKLCAVSPRTQELLDTTHLGSVIELYATEADALESF